MSTAPGACVWLASSNQCQGCYVGVSGLALVLLVVELAGDLYHAGMTPGADDPLYDAGWTPWMTLITWVLIVVSGSFMSASRLCAPSCCSGFTNVPLCCPCNSFTGFDIPYYIWFGFEVAIVGLSIFRMSDRRMLLLLRDVGPLLNVAAFSCAIVKFCIMRGCGCQDMLAQANTQASSVPPGAAPMGIVGQPVGVEEKAND